MTRIRFSVCMAAFVAVAGFPDLASDAGPSGGYASYGGSTGVAYGGSSGGYGSSGKQRRIFWTVATLACPPSRASASRK